MAVVWSQLKKTKYPGVRKDPGTGAYRLRVQVKCRKTGKALDRSRWAEADTAARAAAERAQFLEELQEGGHRAGLGPTRMTLTDYSKRWLKQKKNEGLRPGSLRQNVNVLRKFILPYLGEVYVDALTPMDIRQWQIKVETLKKPDGGKYSQWSVAGWVAVLRNIMRDAVVELGLQLNPAIGLKPVSKPRSPRANRRLTLKQLRMFLKLVERWYPEHYPITLVLAMYGLRWGEAAALHVEHIDEETMELRVVQSHTKGQVTRTKTESHKYLPLDSGVLKVLREHVDWLTATEHPDVEKGLLFPGRFGGYRLPGSCGRAWKKVSKVMGLEWSITGHDLRRTFQNMLRQAGVGLTVQQALMGHSSMGMTEHYSQVGRDEKRQAMDNVVSLINYQNGKEETG